MIDFIDVTIPCENSGNINNGHKVTEQKGKESNKRFFFKRIKSKRGYLQVVSVGEQHLRIIGNPAMFIQGQNIFGTNDINALTKRVAIRIAKKLKIEPTKENRLDWKKGNYDVHRLDITYNFVLPSRQSVSEWLDKAFSCLRSGKQLVEAIRHSTARNVETIMIGKSSNYNSVKFYNKYEQLQNKAYLLQSSDDPVAEQLLDYSKNLLRCEIRLNKDYLKSFNLTKASSLTNEVLDLHYFGKLDRVAMGSSTILPRKDVADLKPTQRLAYELWSKGGDARAVVSESTFDRLRKVILEFGLDIRCPFVDQVDEKSLRSYLDPANVAQAPEFLKNTTWLFEPR